MTGKKRVVKKYGYFVHYRRIIFLSLYTIILVFVSSYTTYAILLHKVSRKEQKIFTNTLLQIVKNLKMPLQLDDLYIERDSPYDNRTVVNATESAQVIFHGPRNKKDIALTFDAEMTDLMRANVLSGKTKSSYDKRIINILNQTNTKATIFMTGMWIKLYPEITKEISNNQLFELGSHSYSDSSYSGFCFGLPHLANMLKIEDIGATEKLLRENAGIKNQLFRFPGGCYTPDDVKLVNQTGDTVVHWDVSGQDGFNLNTNQIVHNIIDNVQNGSIIILHLNGEPTAPKTADALPAIISGLKAQGFTFVKVSELLGLPKENRVQNGWM